jgi:hypothetical protein
MDLCLLRPADREESDAASFLFMARRGGEFEVAGHWPDDDSLAGRQFFCHPDCFTGRMDVTLRTIVFDPTL